MDKKVAIKKAIKSLIQANIDIMNYHLTINDDPNIIKVIKKNINRGRKALLIVDEIWHIEILESLYRSFIFGKEQYFALISATIVKQARKWDSEKGFVEFQELEKQAIEEQRKQEEERQHDEQVIKSAKEMGKKIEMVMKDGRLRPVVVEEPLN